MATVAAVGMGKTYNHSFSEGVKGRFVTLALRGTERYLTLCEVEVYGYLAPTGENLSHCSLQCFPADCSVLLRPPWMMHGRW